jgi:ParB family transcriptional regulator, chromosome partitioning protein
MAEPRKSLGRGLAALIQSEVASEPPSPVAPTPPPAPQDQLLRLPIDRVIVNPEQPRAAFAPGALEELARSITEHGILNPLLVRRDGAQYILIAGERRLRAARLAGLAEVPVIVRAKDAPGVVQLELALIENLQREDLDPIEAALGYQRLVRVYGLSQEEVAQKVGKDRTTVANALRLLKLPEPGRIALTEGRISAGHARALLPLEDPDVFHTALQTVLVRDLSVRATERLVRELRSAPKERSRGADKAIERVSRELTRSLGSKVAVKPRAAGGGRIVIDYHDTAELDRLIGLMRGHE